MGSPFWTVKKEAATRVRPVCSTYWLTLWEGNSFISGCSAQIERASSTHFQWPAGVVDERSAGAEKSAGWVKIIHAYRWFPLPASKAFGVSLAVRKRHSTESAHREVQVQRTR